MMELKKDQFEVIGCNDENSEVILRPNMTYWQDAWRRLKQNKVAMFSMGLLLVIIVMCIIGPHITKHGYSEQIAENINLEPNGEYWFGTDNLGRDIFSRLWLGGRVSIAIGVLGTIIEVIIGCIYGGISGYFGGRVDDIMMRIVEILNSIPYMIVVIILSIYLGAGMASLLIALCITGWTGMARVVRGQVLQLKQSEYVLAAQALGGTSSRIILRHLIPNTIGIIIIYMTFDIPGFIFAEAFLSFIGLGIKPPATSWGAMCAAGQSVMDFYPYQLIFPAVAICLTMLAFNLLGDGLRDALDPKLRQ
ncbi:ABC transporter permease [Clostridium botulinum]|nr:ABC transporter permease [Clostridium botulinum]